MAKKYDAATVKNDARKLISEISEIEISKLKDDAKFSDDLGVDSMKALEIVAAMEKKFKVTIPEEQIPTIRSPKDVYTMIQGLLKL